MTKEMLSRGKRKDNGKWVEGYYVYHISRTPSPVGGVIKPEDEHHLIFFDGFSDFGLPRELRCAEVDPSTVGRCTGLAAKNGVKIFEGDKCRVTRPCVLANGNITFSNGCFCFADDGPGGMLRLYDIKPNGFEIEVIGNIHDNPELIGGEDDG